MSLVPNADAIRLAMLGMIPGNGHPFSWSAIVNGKYDAEAMAACGYPVIPEYLGAAPAGALGIPGARVTHVWCDTPGEAEQVARAACIDNVVARPEDVIGQVDAVVIPTDDGSDHVRRCRPFVEAGLPLFVDKPLADNTEDLRQFVAWQRAGHPLLSTSAMRYAAEFAAFDGRAEEAGEPRVLTMTTPKSWERYGIHALEAMYPRLRPGGWLWAANAGEAGADVVHVRHEDGVDVVLAAIADMYGAFGFGSLYGTKGALQTRFADTFTSFKAQLVAFVDYLRSGQPPFPFEETVELMKIIIAGRLSRERGGQRVMLSEIKVD